MKKIIASIKLAPGVRGYFDPLTGIKITPSSKTAYIYENDNVDNIRRAIKEGKIKIVGGQLPPAISIKPITKKEEVKKPVEKEPEVEIKPEPIKPLKTKKKKEAKKETFPIMLQELEVTEEVSLPVLNKIEENKNTDDTAKAGE